MYGALSIGEAKLDHGIVLELEGEIDVATVNALTDALEHPDDGDVWVDLSGVGFMDSTGLTALVLAHRRLDDPVRRLAVICPAGAVRRVLEIAGIDRVMPVHASRDDALSLI